MDLIEIQLVAASHLRLHMWSDVDCNMQSLLQWQTSSPVDKNMCSITGTSESIAQIRLFGYAGSKIDKSSLLTGFRFNQNESVTALAKYDGKATYVAMHPDLCISAWCCCGFRVQGRLYLSLTLGIATPAASSDMKGQLCGACTASTADAVAGPIPCAELLMDVLSSGM